MGLLGLFFVSATIHGRRFTCHVHVPRFKEVHVPRSRATIQRGSRATFTCHNSKRFTCHVHVPQLKEVHLPCSRATTQRGSRATFTCHDSKRSPKATFPISFAELLNPFDLPSLFIVKRLTVNIHACQERIKRATGGEAIE